MTKKLKQCSR